MSRAPDALSRPPLTSGVHVSEVRATQGGVLAFVAIPSCADDTERLAECDAVRAQLHPQEWTLAAMLAPARRLSFVAGRLAAHAAIQRVAAEADRAVADRGQAPPQPVLRTARGAPAFPAALLGSISHTRRLAVALVREAPQTGASTHATPMQRWPDRPTHPPRTHVGVDVETLPDPEREQQRPDLAPRILTPREMRALPPKVHEGVVTRAYLDAVRIRFSLKESVYKAIDPWVQRHVRFQEVETTLHEDGTATVAPLLPEFAEAGHPTRRISVTGWWMRIDGHCVTGASATEVSW